MVNLRRTPYWASTNAKCIICELSPRPLGGEAARSAGEGAISAKHTKEKNRISLTFLRKPILFVHITFDRVKKGTTHCDSLNPD